jgi:DNA polymerase-1
MFLYQKYKYDYKHLDINNPSHLSYLRELINIAEEVKTDYLYYDTETDGLHIKTSLPFLVSFGFKKDEHKHVITMDYNEEVMSSFWYIINNSKLKDNINFIGVGAHNAKYDYHMMENGGSPIPENIDLFDSITVARLTEYVDEHASMSLETLGGKYVDEEAKFAGKIIKDIIKKLNAERRKQLREDIMNAFPDDGFYTITRSGKKKATGKLSKLIESYDKTRTQFLNDDDPYFKFIDEHYRPANYKDVYEKEPELMRSYAADDIVIGIEYLEKAMPTLLKVDKDLTVTKREGKLIRAVAWMEDTGLKVDVDYVLNCRKNMIAYRDLLYFELQLYTGEEFSVGQHEFIKKLLLAKYKIKTDKADEKALKYIREHSDNEEVKDICSNILELRTLDKWISTYVDGKLNAVVNGRIYTDINNNGAVSGRVSCDMQQQPKEALFDRDGNELFHPRRMFVCDDGFCLAFCDESQMELRVQAYYTIIHASEPDLLMCRAYMPYNCYNENSTKFDYKNPEHIKNYAKHQWYECMTGKEWIPTDLHSATTKNAFPELEEGTPEFKHHRKLGKRANFLKVYQGGVDALMNALDVSRDVAEKLDKAFYKSFPKIREYQEWVTEHLSQYGYVENLYGRRYYMDDSRFYYRACNYLIQGTCADMVKTFEIKVWEYLTKNNLKSRLVLPIHDELMVAVANDEMFVIDEVKRIMEDVTDVIKSIPMISEPEMSTTNWAEKKEYVINEG